MNLNELLRCQGVEQMLKQLVTYHRLGSQIGSAMSQNALERTLISLLPADGLVPLEQVLIGLWKDSGMKKESSGLHVLQLLVIPHRLKMGNIS